jgi:hypothetical protein
MEVNSSGSIILVVTKRPYMIGPYTVSISSPPANSTESPTPSPSVTPLIRRPGDESKVATAVPFPIITVWKTQDIYATAKIAGSNFNITPITRDWQQLDQGKAEWRWNVSPKQTGAQVINASVEIEFRSTVRNASTGTEEKEKPVSGGTVWLEELSISTYRSWFTKDSFTIGSLITGLVGIVGTIGISVPWLVERSREHRQRKKQARVDRIGFIK